MTKPYADKFLDPITDRQSAENMERTNNRLRKRIGDLQTRLAQSVEANHTLRIVNARLRASTDRRTQAVVDATLRKADAL